MFNLLHRSVNVQSASKLHKQWLELSTKTAQGLVWCYVPPVTALGCRLIFNADLLVAFCGTLVLCKLWQDSSELR